MAKHGTVGDLIRMEFRLHLSCGACGHTREVDLEALALARGEGFTLQRLVEIGRCGRCGAKGRCDLAMHPDYGPGGQRK